MSNTPSQNVSREFSIVAEKRQSIRSLPSYKKSHSIPDYDDSALTRFLVTITAAELDEQIDLLFSRLREKSGMRRKEIVVSGPSEGFCVLNTPAFDVEVGVSANIQDQGYCTWRWAISNIRDTRLLVDDRLQSLFDVPVSVLLIPLHDRIDLELLIDHVEDLDESSVSIDYDREINWCEIAFREIPLRVRIDGSQILARHNTPCTPRELLMAYAEFQKRFTKLLPDVGELGA